MPMISTRENEALMSAFKIFDDMREVVLKKLEDAREQKLIGKSLQAEADLVCTKEQMDAIKYLDMKIHQVLIVSKVTMTLGNALSVSIKAAEGHTCDRCWNVVEHIHENGLCDRCDHVIGGTK
jgi:isoleucyl-tRNA synthetase